ncbi:MAG TPA: RluA family pseudouridine synthase [Planctomycetota bacterium]|nr:RluA family pseudouridine synthase [Planctomycetota bacterium]
MPAPILLYEDEDLLVVDKPAGLLSVPTPGASGRTLLDVLAEEGHPVLPVHRLDREVTGCVLLARHERARAALDGLFRERTLEKVYVALVLGRLPKEAGEWRDPILDEGSYARVSARGKRCITRWRVLRQHARAAEVEIELVTGRYNQIRVHFAHHGHALVGDRKYGRGKEDPFRFKRAALHAARLDFAHPLRDVQVHAESPWPADLRALADEAERLR